MTTPLHRFGKDHWSTFLYIETRCVDHGGKLDHRHLRLDGKMHPTKLNDNTALNGHTDRDCIDDLETHGLLKNNGTGVNHLIELTDLGWNVASQLRRHVAGKGQLKDFFPVLPGKDNGKLFKEYNAGDIFLRKIGREVYRMVKTPCGNAIMNADMPASLQGRAVKLYKINDLECMLGSQPRILAMAKDQVTHG